MKTKITVIKGKRRTLLYHRCNGTVTMKYGSCKSQSVIFKDWEKITKIYAYNVLSDAEKRLIKERKERKLTLKYYEAAHYADFTNAFINTCLKADIRKNTKENGISTGSKIYGELITTDTVQKSAGTIFDKFMESFQQGKVYKSDQFSFQNYLCALSVEIDSSGMANGVLTKELVRW